MADVLTHSAGDLAALLCSRVCHDVISPVGALNNGIELLDEPGAEHDAMELIKMGARNASARLQFARLAFGAAGSAGSQIDTRDAEKVAVAFMANEKANFTWNGAAAFLPKAAVKLMLNLVLVANGSIPRGGTINLSFKTDGGPLEIEVKAAGPMIRVPELFQLLHNNQRPENPIDAHGVQHYYTFLLARDARLKIGVTVNSERVVYTARGD